MQLPYLQSDSEVLNRLQTLWRQVLNPLIAVPMNNGIQLEGIVLTASTNVINHKLGRMQQGWVITDINNVATSIYRSQPFNDKTLTLTSSGAVTVNIWVY